MSIKTYFEERKQRKILQKHLPEILDKITEHHKQLVNDDNILGVLKNGKLFGVADSIQDGEYHLSYKFTFGISKKKTLL